MKSLNSVSNQLSELDGLLNGVLDTFDNDSFLSLSEELVSSVEVTANAIPSRGSHSDLIIRDSFCFLLDLSVLVCHRLDSNL